MNKNNRFPTQWMSLAICVIVGLAGGCEAKRPDSASTVSADESAAETITQAACEGQAGFVYVGGGPFVIGSDRTEREYAYRISAEGATDSPAETAQLEANFRNNQWFDREPDRQSVMLPSFCLSENLWRLSGTRVFSTRL